MNSEAPIEIKKPRPRPLSPHLQVYSPLMTMVTSITHRITGVALSVGIVGLTIWLLMLAFAPEKYNEFSECLRSPAGYVFLVGFTMALYYHFCNGIRHLLWDTGAGFELKTIKWTGPFVILASLILTLITWMVVIG